MARISNANISQRLALRNRMIFPLLFDTFRLSKDCHRDAWASPPAALPHNITPGAAESFVPFRIIESGTCSSVQGTYSTAQLLARLLL